MHISGTFPSLITFIQEYIKRKLEQSKQSSGYIMKNSPNLVVGYGTMPNMKAYEENDTRQERIDDFFLGGGGGTFFLHV